MYKVLFLCTGNSCRSQMAEAIVNHEMGGRWQAFSAGTAPADRVHPLTIQVLREIGLFHQGAPKHADVFRGMDFDVVITVCDHAAETCPVWLGKGERLHSGYPDPAAAEGAEAEVLEAFRQVRDQIAAEIPRLLNAWETS